MITRKPIEVCITIDTEFSIGGNFEDPALTLVACGGQVTSRGQRPAVSRPSLAEIPRFAYLRSFSAKAHLL
jgi:hypothetical protein